MSFPRRSPAKIVKVLLGQIVDLQANRIGAGSLDGVDDLHDIAIMQSTGRFNEHGFLNALVFLNLRRRFHSNLVGVLLFTLLESLLKFSRQLTWVVNRTHRFLIEFDLKIRRNRHHQSKRVWLKLAYVFVWISLCRYVRLKAARFKWRHD